MTALAGEGQKVLMIAVSAFHAGKAIAQVVAGTTIGEKANWRDILESAKA